MNNFSVKLGAVTVSTVIVLTACALISEKITDIPINPVQTTSQNTEYTLRDYRGRIAVYEGNKTEPIEVFDIFSNSLPEEEYLKVMAGVHAGSEKELQKLIEAYTS